MRKYTGRMAIALGTLTAAIALGAGAASAGPVITSDPAPGVQAKITGTFLDANSYDCTVLSILGGGVGTGGWWTPGYANGIFLVPSPAVGFCSNGGVVLGSVG
ncbi:hypothetical protein ACFXK0_05255 [Nocardia sp. NPDC059177]|uniref:hypothetical protein n=1 Tax=Nocardia sp. NPDC059177 TaxID=3346759 RepID=UPI00368C1863